MPRPERQVILLRRNPVVRRTKVFAPPLRLHRAENRIVLKSKEGVELEITGPLSIAVALNSRTPLKLSGDVMQGFFRTYSEIYIQVCQSMARNGGVTIVGSKKTSLERSDLIETLKDPILFSSIMRYQGEAIARNVAEQVIKENTETLIISYVEALAKFIQRQKNGELRKSLHGEELAAKLKDLADKKKLRGEKTRVADKTALREALEEYVKKNGVLSIGRPIDLPKVFSEYAAQRSKIISANVKKRKERFSRVQENARVANIIFKRLFKYKFISKKNKWKALMWIRAQKPTYDSMDAIVKKAISELYPRFDLVNRPALLQPTINGNVLTKGGNREERIRAYAQQNGVGAVRVKAANVGGESNAPIQRQVLLEKVSPVKIIFAEMRAGNGVRAKYVPALEALIQSGRLSEKSLEKLHAADNAGDYSIGVFLKVSQQNEYKAHFGDAMLNDAAFFLSELRSHGIEVEKINSKFIHGPNANRRKDLYNYLIKCGAIIVHSHPTGSTVAINRHYLHA